MKEEINKLLADWDDALRLPGKKYWKLIGTPTPQTFFKELPKILPFGQTLLIEGLDMGLSPKTLYQEHPAKILKKVSCDTICPTPDFYHVAFSSEFAVKLCRLIDSQGIESAFYHFKGYSDQSIVFTFHDAFMDGKLVLSCELDPRAVHDFAKNIGMTAEEAAFTINQHEQLLLMQKALNPPWWRRLLNRLKGS